MRKVISILALTFALVTAPAFAQETPAATTEPTPAPVVVTVEQPPVTEPAQPPIDNTAIFLTIIAFVAVLARGVLDYYQHRNVTEAYGTLVQGLVSNTGLTSALQTGYQGLTPEQRRWADLGLSLAEALSRATPGTEDDILQEWAGRIRSAAPQVAQKG